MPAITDYFNKAADDTGTYPKLGVVSAARMAGEVILTCEDLSGWATDTPVHFSTYRLNQDGEVDAATQTDWKGIVVGNTITQLTRIAGATDNGNSTGDLVEVNPTIGWLDDIITGLLKSHNQDGTLKDGIITTAKIKDSNVTSGKIANKSITNEKIADEAVKADNIDFATLDAIGSYSTEEVETPYKWIGGKTIYRKTYVWTGVLKKSDATTIATDEELAKATAITAVRGTTRIHTSGAWGPLPYYNPHWNGSGVGVIIQPGGQVRVLGGDEADAHTRTFYITVEYVKD